MSLEAEIWNAMKLLYGLALHLLVINLSPIYLHHPITRNLKTIRGMGCLTTNPL